MPYFEPQNKTVRIRHTGMFKHDKYTFHPQKDLVFSMPYDFVANLKPGHWTLLVNLWLKSVKKILKKAKTNSIKQIRLHGGRDESILSAKLIRIAPETSSF